MKLNPDHLHQSGNDDQMHAAVPAGTPSWITIELIEHTKKVWQPRYKSPLTAEDAVTILLNVSRLFSLFSRE
jgi:hypothetical protein